MAEAAQRAAQAHAVIDVGAVGIAVAIGEGVVLAVVGDPGDDRPLDRRRAEYGEDPAYGWGGLEGAVREEAVKADGDAEARQHVDDREDDHVRKVQQPVPHLPPDDAEGEDRADRDEPRQGAVERLVFDGLNVL